MEINSEYIKNLRKKLSWSQERLAKALSVSPRTIQNWEAGGVIPQTKHELLHEIDKNYLDQIENYKAVAESHKKKDPGTEVRYDEEFRERLKKVASIKRIDFEELLDDLTKDESRRLPGYKNLGLIDWDKFSIKLPDISIGWMWTGDGSIYNDLSPFSRLLEFLRENDISDEEFYEKTKLREGFLEEPSELEPATQLVLIKNFSISHTWLMTGIGDKSVIPTKIVTEKHTIFRLKVCLTLVESGYENPNSVEFPLGEIKLCLTEGVVPVHFIESFCEQFPFNIDWILYGFGYMMQTSTTFLAKTAKRLRIDLKKISDESRGILVNELDRYKEIITNLEGSDQNYFYARFIRDAYALGYGDVGSFSLLTEQLDIVMNKLMHIKSEKFSDLNLMSDSYKFTTYYDYRNEMMKKYNRLYKLLPALNGFILRAQELISEVENTFATIEDPNKKAGT